METVERVFQAVVFEVATLAIVVPTSAFITGFESDKMLVVSIASTVFAMLWNYIFNIGFDKIAGENRAERGVVVRVAHAISFELGMLIVTLPLLAWYLNITWLAAIFLEAGFLIFILIFTFIFNWLYDKYQPYKSFFGKEKYLQGH